MKTAVTRILALAAMVAALAPPARAALPEEGWWQLDGGKISVNDITYPMTATVGLHVDGQRFCGVAAFRATQENVWLLRGRVVDGRLVEDDSIPIRGPAVAFARDARLRAALRYAPPQPIAPTDYFVQPTALVRRDRSTEQPRGEFAVFEPLPAAPSTTLWLDMVWACSSEAEVEKLAQERRE